MQRGARKKTRTGGDEPGRRHRGMPTSIRGAARKQDVLLETSVPLQSSGAASHHHPRGGTNSATAAAAPPPPAAGRPRRHREEDSRRMLPPLLPRAYIFTS